MFFSSIFIILLRFFNNLFNSSLWDPCFWFISHIFVIFYNFTFNAFSFWNSFYIASFFCSSDSIYSVCLWATSRLFAFWYIISVFLQRSILSTRTSFSCLSEFNFEAIFKNPFSSLTFDDFRFLTVDTLGSSVVLFLLSFFKPSVIKILFSSFSGCLLLVATWVLVNSSSI